MKVLLVTGNCLPRKNGGIENYTHWLAGVLVRHHFEVEVAALNVSEPGDYNYQGIKINNLESSFSSFENLLSAGNFNICHFHEYSENGGIEIPWFKKAKEYCSKVFFTFHLPYFTCYKNDFRYKGVEDCNVFSDSKRCTECVIADKMGYRKSDTSELYLALGLAFMRLTGQKRKLQDRIKSKYVRLNELIEVCDALFIYADWFKNILFENGYNSPALKKIPYKTKSEFSSAQLATDKYIKNKIIFVGRIQEQKGLHLLCEAMNHVDTNISLDVYGNIINQDYYDRCFKKYSFNFKGTTGYYELLAVLKDYDFLVMPSVFSEMYSMMIKDASYERLPVIASKAKGNKDAVVDGINGFLFNYNDSKDLALTIEKAYALKWKGWKPAFIDPDDPEKDIQEIISYYR